MAAELKTVHQHRSTWARLGVARVAVPVSSAAGLPTQVETPDDVLRYGKTVIAHLRD